MRQLEGDERERFLRELGSLVNRYSLENDSDTPDWILALHMLAALEAYGSTTRARERWHGRNL